MTNPMRGEVPFPAGGEGCVLRLTNADLAGLQGVYGPDWFDKVRDGLGRYDFEITGTILKVAPKVAGTPRPVDFMALTQPVVEVVHSCMDALFMAIHGRTFEDYMADVAKKMVEASGPQSGPASS